MKAQRYPLIRFWVGSLVVLSVLGTHAPAASAAPELSLVPVGGVENEIVLPGGGLRVEVELYVSGWDPNLLGTYQATIDPAGFTSGLQGTVTPATEPCSIDAECVAAFGPGVGSVCVDTDADTVPDTCTGALIDESRADYVFAGVATIPAVNTADPLGSGIQYGSSVADPADARVDPGVPQYAGTLFLDVSPDALETFTISMRADPNDTFLNDENGLPIPGLVLTVQRKVPNSDRAQVHAR